MNNESKSHQFYERLKGCEVKISNLKDKIEELKDVFSHFCDNHFVTFNKEIRSELKCLTKKINKRPTWLLTGIVSSLLALCTGLIVFLLTH